MARNDGFGHQCTHVIPETGLGAKNAEAHEHLRSDI